MTAMDNADWISRDAAIQWLIDEYDMSDGAAQAQLNTAIGSGNVRRIGWFANFAEPMPITRDDLVTAFLLRDQRLSFADLRWQIEKQSPKRTPRAKAKPQQETLNQALLKYAKRIGRKLKQNDAEARAMLTGRGATTRQVTAAFRELPEEYRFGVGESDG